MLTPRDQMMVRHTVFKFTWYKLARQGKCSGGKALTWISSLGDWGDSPGGRRGRRWRLRPRSRSRWGQWWLPPTRRSCPLYSVQRLFLRIIPMKSSFLARLDASYRLEDSERAACVLPWAFSTLSPPLMIIHKRWGFGKLSLKSEIVTFAMSKSYIFIHSKAAFQPSQILSRSSCMLSIWSCLLY